MIWLASTHKAVDTHERGCPDLSRDFYYVWLRSEVELAACGACHA